MSLLKKIVITFSLFIFLSVSTLTSFAKPASAQWYNQNYWDWYDRVYDDSNPAELFGERYTAAQVQWVFYGFFSVLMNAVSDPDGNFIQCIREVIQNPSITNISAVVPCASWATYVASWFSPIGQTLETSPIAAIFTFRPVSTRAYFQDIGERLNIVPEAQAQQGFGFETAATGVLNLWRAVRDIAYVLMTIVVVILAFMIMFRVRISPQTIISVQIAIPRIVIALILITFSYAIAGLLIDLMYVALGIFTTIATTQGLSTDTWAELFGKFVTNVGAASMMFAYLGLWILTGIFVVITGLGLGADFFSNSIFGLLVLVVGIFVILWLIIKIYWMLGKNYLGLLFTIVLGPLLILTGTISGAGFGGWVKNMVKYLAVYPVMAMFALFAFITLRAAAGNAGGLVTTFGASDILAAGDPWAPPFSGYDDIGFLWLIASLGVMMMIPKIPDMIGGALSGKGISTALDVRDLGEGRGAAIGYAGYATGRIGERRLPIPFINRQFAEGGRFDNVLGRRAERVHRFGQRARWWTGKPSEPTPPSPSR